MALGTSYSDRPWAATVFFAYDENFNLLFYSREDTKHCRNITKNQYVSVVINHDWKDGRGHIRGLQMTGRAYKVLGQKYKRYYALYKSRFSWADDFAADHVLYLIKPSTVWYIDEKFFGHFYRVRIR